MKKIAKAQHNQIPELKNCLNDSKLQDEYFNGDSITESFIRDSIDKDELYVCLDHNNKVLGFIRIDHIGMFSNFPLLRCIAVNPNHRNMGIGKSLLDYFEETEFEHSDKVFLCVSDFNDSAKKLYTSVGYEEVGSIKDLYKKGITERIMMKSIHR